MMNYTLVLYQGYVALYCCNLLQDVIDSYDADIRTVMLPDTELEKLERCVKVLLLLMRWQIHEKRTEAVYKYQSICLYFLRQKSKGV